MGKSWILRGKPENCIKNGELLEGAPFPIDSVLFQNDLLYVSNSNEFICFVDSNDVRKVNYVQYWSDLDRKIDRKLNSEQFQQYWDRGHKCVHSPHDIIALYATPTCIFALTVSERDHIVLIRWKKFGERFEDNPCFCWLENILPMDLTSIKIIVSDTAVMASQILIYGLSDGSVYSGRIPHGQSKIRLTKAPKLSSFCEHPDFIFTTTEEKIDKKQPFIEYYGFEKNTNCFFIYQLSSSQEEDTKILIRDFSCKEDGFFHKKLNISAMLIKNIKLFFDINIGENERPKNTYVSNLLLFAISKSHNTIYIINPNDEVFQLKSLKSSFSIEAFDKLELLKSSIGLESFDSVDSIAIVDSQLLIFGSSVENTWIVYRLPHYRRSNSTYKSAYSENSSDS